MPYSDQNDLGKQGFAGRLANIKLSDLIQMCCASGISTVIQVRKDKSVGTIFIDEGEIVHAACGDAEGLGAFYEIFSWESGSFETLGDASVPRTTIDKNWQYLIMESHRRMDEARAARLPACEEDGNETNNMDLSETCLQLSAEEISPEPSCPPARVLIVDDSAIMCRVLTEMLSSEEDIRVVGTARNGEDALAQIDRVRPDLITLDVNMPVMDGSTALKHIMIRSPCPVVIVSAANAQPESNIINFLLLGAIDYVQKPVRGEDSARQRLVRAVRQASQARTDRFRRARPPQIVPETGGEPRPLTSKSRLVVVCSGAGGYAELVKFVPLIPTGLKAALVVMQAMAPAFRKPFAAYLHRRSRIQVRPLDAGTAVHQGCCYLASDDRSFWLAGDKEGYVLEWRADRNLSGDGMPDMFLASAADAFRERLLVVLLSGADPGDFSGLRAVRKQGGRIISQNIPDCLVSQPLEAASKAGLVSASMGIRGIVSEVIHETFP